MIKNILANYAGRFWSIFSNILFVPLYIKLLGIEGYSVIGFSIVLAGIMAILDVGLTATLSKEFASAAIGSDEKRRVFHTLETIYVAIAGLIIAFFMLASGWIAENWINPDTIPSESIALYLRIIGIGIAFQLLSQFYWGGLMGLEKQVLANSYQVSLGIVRNGFIIIPLIFFPSLILFFIWQSSVMVLYTFVVRKTVADTIKLKESPGGFMKLDQKVISRTWRFAGGIMLISLVAAINTQMDKLAISKLLPIEKLGYYTLAVSLAQGLSLLISPIGSAVFPRLTSLYSGSKKDEAVSLFFSIFRISNLILFAFALNLAFNSEQILWIWTGNKAYAAESAAFMPYLILGMTMLSLQVIPYYVALANGYTRYNNVLGILSLILTVPGYWLMTWQFGAVGAAFIWGTVQTITTPVYLFLICRRFLGRNRIVSIFSMELLLPGFVASASAFILSLITAFDSSRWISLAWIGFSTLLTLLILYLVFYNKKQFMAAVGIIRGRNGQAYLERN
jgi:O-antigen/teichoic acid export membrane protein